MSTISTMVVVLVLGAIGLLSTLALLIIDRRQQRKTKNL